MARAQGDRAVLDPVVLSGPRGPDGAEGALSMRVVVVGAARTGIAVARFCAARGDQVLLTDKTEAVRAGQVPPGVRLELGGHRVESFATADLVVVSPGVPSDIPELRAARRAGVPVIGE